MRRRMFVLSGLMCVTLVFGCFGAPAQADASADTGGAAKEEVVILNQRLTGTPINLQQGGQFIEPLCNLIPSMIAQQVAGDSFEEEPPYAVAYKRDIDKPFRPWYPDGAVHTAQFEIDTENPFNGARSQKIILNKPRCRAGISQDGFYTKEGLRYRLRLHARSTGNLPVWASLHGGGRMLAEPAELKETQDAWAPLEAEFTAEDDCDNATLTIEAEGPGTLWIDRVSLIGKDAVLGIWRPDVVEALKGLNPGVIRWGGSTTEGYEWTQCIGPWDQRAPFTTCWGGLEPNFVGMEEFVQLCRLLGAEPLLCLRWSGKTPEDAAAQVEYFNGAEGTKWGSLRAKHGHPVPYAVKYWQIGNEVGGDKYDRSVRAFAEAMKAADPSIKIFSAFLTDHTLAQGGDYLDYLCPHHYGCEDLAGKADEFQRLREQIQRDGHGRDVRVAVTEWNTTAGDWGLGRGTLQTLYNALACSRYQNLMHRNADLVEIAIRSNLADSFGSGVIVTGPGWLYVAPTYYAQTLYQRAAGSYPLRLARAASSQESGNQPDISAVLSEDGAMLRIYAVNTSQEVSELSFRLENFPAQIDSVTYLVLRDTAESPSSEAMNTRDNPRRIVPEPGFGLSPSNPFEAKIPPLSLILYEIQLANPHSVHVDEKTEISKKELLAGAEHKFFMGGTQIDFLLARLQQFEITAAEAKDLLEKAKSCGVSDPDTLILIRQLCHPPLPPSQQELLEEDIIWHMSIELNSFLDPPAYDFRPDKTARIISTERKEPIFSEEQETFLREHKDFVSAWAFKALTESGDCAAALLLGMYQEKRAIPLLRFWFLHADNDNYGWEGQPFLCFWEYSYRYRYTYEVALEALTGKPLAESVAITDAETAWLQHRIEADADHLKEFIPRDWELPGYLLWRLNPDAARKTYFKIFRKDKRLFMRGYIMEGNLTKILGDIRNTDELREALGPPDAVVKADELQSPLRRYVALLRGWEEGWVYRGESDQIPTQGKPMAMSFLFSADRFLETTQEDIEEEPQHWWPSDLDYYVPKTIIISEENVLLGLGSDEPEVCRLAMDLVERQGVRKIYLPRLQAISQRPEFPEKIKKIAQKLLDGSQSL